MYGRSNRRRTFRQTYRSSLRRPNVRVSTGPNPYTGLGKTLRRGRRFKGSRRFGMGRRYAKRTRYAGRFRRGRRFRGRRYGKTRRYGRKSGRALKGTYVYRQISARGCTSKYGESCWFDAPSLGEPWRLNNVQNDAIFNYLRDSRETRFSGYPALTAAIISDQDPATNQSRDFTQMINDNITAEGFYLKGQEKCTYTLRNAGQQPASVTLYQYCPKRSNSIFQPFCFEAPCGSSAGGADLTHTFGSLGMLKWLYPRFRSVYGSSDTGVAKTDPTANTALSSNVQLLNVPRRLGAFKQRFPPRYTARILSGTSFNGPPGAQPAPRYNRMAPSTDNSFVFPSVGAPTVPGSLTVDWKAMVENAVSVQGIDSQWVANGTSDQFQSANDLSVVAGRPTADPGLQVDWSVHTGYNEKKNEYLRRYFKIKVLGRVRIPIGGRATFTVKGNRFTMNPIRDNMLDPVVTFTVSSGQVTSNQRSMWSLASAQSGQQDVGYEYPNAFGNGGPLSAGCTVCPNLLGPGEFTKTCPISFHVKGETQFNSADEGNQFLPRINIGAAQLVVQETYSCRYRCSMAIPKRRHLTEVNMLDGSNTPSLLVPFAGPAPANYLPTAVIPNQP